MVRTTSRISSSGTYITFVFKCALILNQVKTKMDVKLSVNNPLDTTRTKGQAIHMSFHPGPEKTIQANKYANLKTLESVHIPATITSIEAHAFAGCTKLTHVHFEGDRAPEIHPLAFSGCNLGRTN